MFLDPASCQLLFMHLQPAVISRATTSDDAAIAHAADALAQMATVQGVPISFGLAPQEDGTSEPIEPLRPHADATNSFAGHVSSGMLDPALVARLCGHRRSVLILAGAATEVVVAHTALDALAAGFAVYVPVDAIGGLSKRTERVALDQIARAGGVVTSTPTLLASLAPDFSSPDGQAAMRLLAGFGRKHQN